MGAAQEVEAMVPARQGALVGVLEAARAAAQAAPEMAEAWVATAATAERGGAWEASHASSTLCLGTVWCGC